jgi:hypothetical protein
MELPTVLTPERRSFLIDNRKLCESWFDRMLEQALDDALNGRPCGGKKAIDGRKAPDKWKDIDGADARSDPAARGPFQSQTQDADTGVEGTQNQGIPA